MMGGVRQRPVAADGSSSGASGRPTPTAPSTGAAAASPERRTSCRWPLLPGCWSDDPAPARKAWLTCSFDRMLNG